MIILAEVNQKNRKKIRKRKTRKTRKIKKIKKNQKEKKMMKSSNNKWRLSLKNSMMKNKVPRRYKEGRWLNKIDFLFN